MNRKKYINRIFKIAIPIMISNIIVQVQMIIDRIFLGRIDKYNMTAVCNVTAPMWTTMSVIFSLVIGSSILISQAVGAGDKEKSEAYAAAMIKWNNVIAVLFFFFWAFGSKTVFKVMGVSDAVMPLCQGYVKYYVPVFLITGLGASITVILQTSNYTKPLIFYGLIRAGLNIVLDWLLIFGHMGFPKMGIEGAALATTIAEYVGGVYILLIFIFSKKIATKPSYTAIRKASLMPYLSSIKLGAPAALEDFCWNFGNLMLIRILNSIDEIAAGIFTMVFNVEIIAVVIISAIGNATMTLSGEATGSKNKEMFSGVIKLSYAMTAMISTVTLIACVLIPRQMLSLFTTEADIIESSAIFLLYMGINLYSKSGNIIIGSGIRGYGDTKWMFYTQIFGTIFVISVAALLVYVFNLGISGVFLAVIADEMVRFIINLLKHRSIVNSN